MWGKNAFDGNLCVSPNVQIKQANRMEEVKIKRKEEKGCIKLVLVFAKKKKILSLP